jgi:hypothetical protein
VCVFLLLLVQFVGARALCILIYTHSYSHYNLSHYKPHTTDAVSPLVHCVRFPALSTAQLASLVAPLELWGDDKQILLQLFTYTSARSSFSYTNNPLFHRIQHFAHSPRQPRMMPPGWVWVCSKCSTYTLNDRTLCAKCHTSKKDGALAYPRYVCV